MDRQQTHERRRRDRRSGLDRRDPLGLGHPGSGDRRTGHDRREHDRRGEVLLPPDEQLLADLGWTAH